MDKKLYIEPEMLRKFAEAPEADNIDVWNLLAESASRLFDRACDVEDGFFGKAGVSAAEKTVQSNGTAYLRLPPFVEGSITGIIEVSPSSVETLLSESADYDLRESYLIRKTSIGSFIFRSFYDRSVKYKITARFGFPDIPADVRQAVIEQALMLWRRKDLAFTELSGVSTAVAQAAYSPTFQVVSEKYRALYSGIVFA